MTALNAHTELDFEDWDAEPSPQSLGRALDHRILQLTTAPRANLTPMQRLALIGGLGPADFHHIRELTPGGDPAALKKVPLEFMYFQSKDKIAEWEYLAGQRFRHDFDIAHSQAKMVSNIMAGSMYDTETTRKHRSEGWHGKGGARNYSAHSIADARIDAMSRRGAFMSDKLISFYLAELIIGHEFWPKEIAAYMGDDPRYIGKRFREALADLAGFYRIHVQACPRPRPIRGHIVEKATLDAWKDDGSRPDAA